MDGADPQKRALVSAAVWSGCYLAAQMMSDIASLRIVVLAGMSMDAGTLVYPFTFTLRDLVHKSAGKSAARALIVVAAAVNLAMAGLFWLVGRLPADLSAGPQEEFAAVLSPVWRIVIASILAELVSELLDTEVYSYCASRLGGRRQWARVLFSNLAAIPVDTLLFCWLAFGGVFPAPTVWSIVTANLVLKGLVTLVSVPSIYLVRDRR